MSEEKVLTLRGKKAVWAPGGGTGGGVFNVKFVSNDGANCTADKTFEEIVDAVYAGLLVIAQFWEKHPETGVEIRSGVLTPSSYLDIPEAGHILEIVFSSVSATGDEVYVNILRMNKANGALFSQRRLMTSV